MFYEQEKKSGPIKCDVTRINWQSGWSQQIEFIKPEDRNREEKGQRLEKHKAWQLCGYIKLVKLTASDKTEENFMKHCEVGFLATVSVKESEHRGDMTNDPGYIKQTYVKFNNNVYVDP